MTYRMISTCGVEVSLPQDAAVALGDVGGPPGRVQVVQGDGPVLDVGADAHLLGGADQDGDPAGPAGGEQLRLVPVGLGLVDEPDRLRGQAAGDELVAELVVGVPARPGSAQVAEHQLQRSAHRVRDAAGVEVLVVLVRCPDRGDPVGGRGDLARGGLRQAEQPQVQRGAAAVAGDLEHVVLVRVHGPVADLGGPVAEVAHVVEQFVGRLDGHGFRYALPVGARLEVRDGQGQVLGGLHVGGHVQHPRASPGRWRTGRTGFSSGSCCRLRGPARPGRRPGRRSPPRCRRPRCPRPPAGPAAGSAASRRPR